MTDRPIYLTTDPSHFDVFYQINPWMQPDTWRADPETRRAAALTASADLIRALKEIGGSIENVPAVEGLPDLVFPANAAIVLDGRVLPARFRYPERQGEEAVFRTAFEKLKARGLVREIVEFPAGVFQEGAGDCIWDADRDFFWVGYGQRSTENSIDAIAETFGQPIVALELATDRFYHLDTCFCPLAGGKVLYYPAAFTPQALGEIRTHIRPEDRIEASDEEAAAFCVNAVNLGHKIIMARAPETLRRKLTDAGYEIIEVDLAPFILSGGAAYCMTLRLDRTSAPQRTVRAAE
ncbi:MAG TPA: arginine deiminase-related protein [Rhizomicrobium sp.]